MIKSLVIGALVTLFFVGGAHGGGAHLGALAIVWLVISGVTYLVLGE